MMIEMSINEKGVLVLTLKNVLSKTTYSINLSAEDFIKFEDYEEPLIVL